MTSKPFFQCIAFAVIACCIAIFALVTFQLAEQFIGLATDYAGGISRLLP